jgi:hypothetical protein
MPCNLFDNYQRQLDILVTISTTTITNIEWLEFAESCLPAYQKNEGFSCRPSGLIAVQNGHKSFFVRSSTCTLTLRLKRRFQPRPLWPRILPVFQMAADGRKRTGADAPLQG